MTDPDTPYADVWHALRRAGGYRCTGHRPDGRRCCKPTRNVARDAAGRLRPFCLPHVPRKARDR